MPNATGSLPSLATPDDIVARLGRNLNQVEALRVDAMLQDGSAIIRRNARNSFTYVAQDTIIVSADDGKFVLPGKPIHSVDSVTALFGLSTIPNIRVTWFVFDGIDTVTIPEPIHSGIINLPYDIFATGWYCYSYETVYTHGETEVPAEIKGMLCSAIISELSTPTMSATLQSESIGAYSYSMRRASRTSSTGASGPQAGMYAALIDFGMMDLLSDYRRKQGTIGVRR
jgi:hypothetical protein